ncbi:hypothetical protein [Granulicoccus phenolivorans]|uniref:hypothetical protein n=1 Tax=Granulicoccus phenolivorans TaxID=266854 RepID=UPI00041DE237|nr:hypothetical protein [Granulicoccus phenolivorans]
MTTKPERTDAPVPADSPSPSPTRIRRPLRTIGLLGLVALLAAGAIKVVPLVVPPRVIQAPAPPREAVAGQLIEATDLGTVSPDEVARQVTDGGLEAPPQPVAVRTVRLAYATTDTEGRRQVATGLLVFPAAHGDRLDPAVYAHGTSLSKGLVASMSDSTFLRSPGLALAAAGYAAVLPDYLGLGGGTGPHPYLHHASEATAARDMLPAAAAYLRGEGAGLNQQVLISGFSQGGSAALALARQLEADPAGWRPRAVAAISGPYDIAGSQLPAMRAGRVDPRASTIYMAYVLTAWNDRLSIYTEPGELFRAPYAGRVERLMDGNHAELVTVLGLPATPGELLTDAGLAQLDRPTGAFAAGVAENDQVCRNWVPSVPVQLYATAADEQVAPGSTETCADALRGSGAGIEVTALEVPATAQSAHIASSRVGLDRVLGWWSTEFPA